MFKLQLIMLMMKVWDTPDSVEIETQTRQNIETVETQTNTSLQELIHEVIPLHTLHQSMLCNLMWKIIYGFHEPLMKLLGRRTIIQRECGS